MTAIERRERNRAAMRADILQLAQEQIAATGEVSLRGVAKAMGYTTPALYRYYASTVALEAAAAKDIRDQAASVAEAFGWQGYARWAADNPRLMALLARHPQLLAHVHAQASAA